MSLPTSWTSRAGIKTRIHCQGEGATVKFVKILLPINQHGTTEACATAAFGLAERFSAL
jgi:hypothetical protein